MKDLDKIREIFLSEELDEETIADNAAALKEWESTIAESEAFLAWQAHDITKLIVAQAKASYKEFGVRLATERTMDEKTRMSLWARQDACTLLVEMADRDARGALEQVEREIKSAINAT